MITHLILMNLRQAEDGPFVTAQVLSLQDQVPGLMDVRGGRSAVQLKTTWDLGFVMTFIDADAVRAYQTHPAHLEVGSQIRELISQMATCDIGGDLSPEPDKTTQIQQGVQMNSTAALIPADHIVVPNAKAEHHRITHVEGVQLSGPVDVRVLSEGEDMILLEVTMPPNAASNPHTHDHESVGYLVSGRGQTVVDGETFDLAPGDGFRHPVGVLHHMKAGDEGAVWLEIKSPPTRTW